MEILTDALINACEKWTKTNFHIIYAGMNCILGLFMISMLPYDPEIFETCKSAIGKLIEEVSHWPGLEDVLKIFKLKSLTITMISIARHGFLIVLLHENPYFSLN